MKIVLKDSLNEIKNIVQQKAKYQKVMLLFDDNVGNLEIAEVYNHIKQDCIFNQSHINDLDYNELYNGYKLIIFMCSVDNFLTLNIADEFVNIFVLQSNEILPFYLNTNNQICSSKSYIVMQQQGIDINCYTSLCFNKFYNYFNDILHCNSSTFDYMQKEITQSTIGNTLEELDENFSFVDIEILKNTCLKYKDLPILDLLLINAFIILLEGVKFHNIMLVDVYKSAKEDTQQIDKFYMMHNNDSFFCLINLNYNCLINACKQAKKQILSNLSVENTDVEFVINELKNYAKKSKNLVGYLYLYNIFNV